LRERKVNLSISFWGERGKKKGGKKGSKIEKEAPALCIPREKGEEEGVSPSLKGEGENGKVKGSFPTAAVFIRPFKEEGGFYHFYDRKEEREKLMGSWERKVRRYAVFT